MMHFFAHSYKKILRFLLIQGFILIILAENAFPHAISPAVPAVCTSAVQSYHHLLFSGTNACKYMKNNILNTRAAVYSERRWMAPLEGNAGGGATVSTDVQSIVLEAAIGEEVTQNYSIIGSGFPKSQLQIISISVSPSGPFTISTDGVIFVETTVEMVVETSSSGEFQTYLIVKYAPTDAGPHSATITHSSDVSEDHLLPADGNVTTTPVEWQSFSAKAVKEALVLDWVTASEKNNSHFEVELSNDPAAGFEKIGKVNSKVENSRLATHYRFNYHLGKAFGIYYFRLKQVDIDQAFSYSKLIAVEVSAISGAKVIVTPNPINASSQISITAAKAGKLNIVLLNVGGTEVYSKIYELERGSHSIALHLNNQMPAGLYILNTEFEGQLNRLKLLKE